MKKYLFIILLIGICFSQKNNVYTEFGGAGYRYYFVQSKLLFNLKGYNLSLGKLSATWPRMSIGWSF